MKQTATKKAKDFSKLSIIEHIERIVNITDCCELSDEALKECLPHTKLMGNILNLNHLECIFLSIIMDMYKDSSIETTDIARHFSCRNITILRYNNVLESLTDKCYIKRNNTSYKVPESTVQSLLNNKAVNIISAPIIDKDKLFDIVDEYFLERDDNEISTTELDEKLIDLYTQNSQLSFVNKLKKIIPIAQDDNYSILLFSYMCRQLIVDADDEIILHELERLFDSQRVFRSSKQRLKESCHPLFRQKLIEIRKKDGLFSRDYYCLTDKARKEVLVDYKLPEADTEKTPDNYISHNNITEKHLFYNKEEETQIQQLSQLLSEQQFRDVQSRLEKQGMRKGFAALFHGTPGTGKTETVLQIARQTGRDIISINVSEVKSMWVGQSEKNIKAVFDDYREKLKSSPLAPILLFNEADAILGNRMKNTQRAVDKMENSIQNIILQEMETLDGIMIATTNLTDNLDSAFERRFLYKIEFNKPSVDAKQSIWLAMLPSLSSKDAHTLATNFDFSGGQIENIVRKQTVEHILNGKTPSLETIINFCKQENISKTQHHKKVGF